MLFVLDLTLKARVRTHGYAQGTVGGNFFPQNFIFPFTCCSPMGAQIRSMFMAFGMHLPLLSFNVAA